MPRARRHPVDRSTVSPCWSSERNRSGSALGDDDRKACPNFTESWALLNGEYDAHTRIIWPAPTGVGHMNKAWNSEARISTATSAADGEGGVLCLSRGPSSFPRSTAPMVTLDLVSSDISGPPQHMCLGAA